MQHSYKLQSEVIVYPGMNAWRFLVLPKDIASEIRRAFGAQARGWGSLSVSVVIGKTKWETSIFPDKKSGTYLLPLKAKVRRAEEIDDGARVSFTLTIRL